MLSLLQTVSFCLPQSIIPTSSSRPYLPLLQHHVPHLIFAHSLPTNMQDVTLTIVVLLSRVSLLSRSTCHDTVDGGPSTNPSSTNERGDSSATSVPLSQRTYIRSLLSVELEAKTARPTLPSPHYWFISSWRRSACVHGSSMGTDCTETGIQLIELFLPTTRPHQSRQATRSRRRERWETSLRLMVALRRGCLR